MSFSRILIVEDDDVDREKLSRLLRTLDDSYVITEAQSGAEARARLQCGSFDCIFLDFQLGDCTALELIEEIRAHAEPPPAIIVITGFGNETIAAEAIRCGASDYLTKSGLGPHVLQAKIELAQQKAKTEGELRQAQDRLQRLSMSDALTSLPNRHLFFDRLGLTLSMAQRARRPFTLMVMDLNFFKDVNDNLGHAAGDSVLQQVGHRLEKALRASDTIARLGGDEFAAILPDATTIEAAIAVANKIIDSVAEPIAFEDKFVSLGISIGIALFPSCGVEAAGLIANADAAMYRAKRGGRGYEFHDGAHSPESEHSVLISPRLLLGMKNGELKLDYQPKFDLVSGVMVGVEALVRWHSPELGLLYPAQFIPSAERTSVIKPLTYVVLDMALAQARLWRDDDIQLPVAVNLSARMLDDKELAERVDTALIKHGIPADQLTLEVTETALMADPARAKDLLGRLAAAGIRISIDDFGIGYTSLRQLRDLEIAEIKIDRLFVTDLTLGSRDESIVRSVLSLGKGFGIDVVVEGIEDRRCLKLVRDLGCEYGQGFGLRRPVPADQIAA